MTWCVRLKGKNIILKNQGAFKKSSDLSLLCKKALISEDVESVPLVGIKRSRKYCARLSFRLTKSVVLHWSHPYSRGECRLCFFWNAITFLIRKNEQCHGLVHNGKGIRDANSQSGE